MTHLRLILGVRIQIRQITLIQRICLIILHKKEIIAVLLISHRLTGSKANHLITLSIMLLIHLLKVLFLKFWMKMIRKRFIGLQWIHLASHMNHLLDLVLLCKCHLKKIHSKNLKLILVTQKTNGQSQVVHPNKGLPLRVMFQEVSLLLTIT